MNYIFYAAIAAGSFILCTLLTRIEIPVLKRVKAGQNIREEGPSAHLAKAGTPTMGGIAIIITLIAAGIAVMLKEKNCNIEILCILLLTLSFGGIGFCDDFLKIVKHHNEGLSSGQKLILQISIGFVFSLIRFFCLGSKVYIPFICRYVDFGILIVPFSCFVFTAMTNAVNLTDGLDGLSSSVSLNNALAFAFVLIMYRKTAGAAAGGCVSGICMSFALAGVCAGFLVFNHHPAKIFMGDTGSLALGACLSGIAMTSGFDLMLPVAGIIYVCEALSVIIQVYVFKTQNGRRFFRMAPLHHHFELGGWSEVKVDTVFSLITLFFALICLFIFR